MSVTKFLLYFRNIVIQARLTKEVRKLRSDVKTLHKSIASMNAEILKLKGPQESDNPWQIGVPYGYRNKRDSSRTRRRN